MWADFWLAVLVGFILAYVPSYVILRTCRFSKIVSAAFAPIISLLFYSLLAVVLAKANIYTDGWRLFLPFCAVAAVVVCVGVVLRRRKRAAMRRDRAQDGASALKRLFDESARMILLYVGVGIVVTCYVFLMSLDTANCTTYAYDDQSHLGYVQSFLERGNYSSICANYEDFERGGADGYYPAAWHMFAASLVSICGIENMVGINAVMFLIAALFFPLSCLMAVTKLFPGMKSVQISGAFFTLAFSAFPWEMFVYGRLASNLLAFCFLPAMLACTFSIIGKGICTRTRVAFAVLLFLSFVLSVFTQPSVCFSWLYFSVPYVAYAVWMWKPEKSKRFRVLLVIGFCFAVFVFLIFCYMLPFLWSLTRWKWPARLTITQAIFEVLLQCDQKSPASIVLALLVVLGIFFAVKKPNLRWLIVLYAMFACLYVLDSGTNLKLKNYTTGWWYTDSHRVLAMFAIASYFLVTLGIGGLVKVVMGRLDSQNAKSAVLYGVPVLVMVLALVPSFTVGSTSVQTPIGHIRTVIKGAYSVDTPDDGVFYSTAEREFVQKAAEITGDDLVFNIPKDGSAFAYQTSGMKTFIRWCDDGIFSNASKRIVQRNLDDYASSLSVRNAVEDLGIKYVLMLDQGHEPFHAFWGDYSDSNWTGVLNIDEDTPGFELVMSEGDMKLYRILSEEELADQSE